MNAAMINFNVIFAVLVTLISLLKADKNNYKLEFVQLMYRHGDRAPEKLYPKTPNPESKWPFGLGSLTKLGKIQQYSLGRLFKKMYKGFYTTKPNEIEAVSTDVPRCLMSAEANIAAFFAPTDKYRFKKHLNWQPIPISSFPLGLDHYLGRSHCPALDKAISKLLNSPSNKAFDAKHKKLYKYLTKHSGMKITTFHNASDLHDTLNCEMQHKLKIPKWVPHIYDELKEVEAYTYPLLNNSTEIHKLRAGPVLGLINKYFDKKQKKKLQELKFRTYSTHDSNVAAVLGALENLKVEIVQYCATIIFEMYSGASHDYFIRLLYLNSPRNNKLLQTPRVLTLPGCEEYCPYKKYLKFTNTYALVDYDKECGNKK